MQATCSPEIANMCIVPVCMNGNDVSPLKALIDPRVIAQISRSDIDDGSQ